MEVQMSTLISIPKPADVGPTPNVALREIAARLDRECRALAALAVEVTRRDALSSDDAAALGARLTLAQGRLAAIVNEVGAAASLIFVSGATRDDWTGAAVVEGGLDQV
jgi:hypothetical protein